MGRAERRFYRALLPFQGGVLGAAVVTAVANSGHIRVLSIVLAMLAALWLAYLMQKLR